MGSSVNADDTLEMLPKSRRALTIQEIAALARSSLQGISQVVKDHVTKPTAMAQGRVAHLIEWKGWSKPSDPPAALEGHRDGPPRTVATALESGVLRDSPLWDTFGAPCLGELGQLPGQSASVLGGRRTCRLLDLSAGQDVEPDSTLRKENRSGDTGKLYCVRGSVAEQFAIAEAKLRAWSSVDGEDSNDDSYDEDYPANETSYTSRTTGVYLVTHTHTDVGQRAPHESISVPVPFV
ncbi:hypothetical protein Z043_122077 [Scleropages formosus]|uniref:Protein FAM131A-like n=1 Tax=Scleropages formosus TaxID=113540 RepID=A0A0P7TQB3_SCLFO|nr:hypothetical protein Z043_122077 [Scleropages formosus]